MPTIKVSSQTATQNPIAPTHVCVQAFEPKTGANGADTQKQKAMKAFVWVNKEMRHCGVWSCASDQWECDVHALFASVSGFYSLPNILLGN